VKARQGGLGRELAALEGQEALLGELVEVEAEAVYILALTRRFLS